MRNLKKQNKKTLAIVSNTVFIDVKIFESVTYAYFK